MNEFMYGMTEDVFRSELSSMNYMVEEYTKKAAIVNYICGGLLEKACNELLDIIADASPLNCPMTWSHDYPELMWEPGRGRLSRSVTLNAYATRIEFGDTVSSTNNTFEYKDATVVVKISSSPCREAWRRWSDRIIYDFFNVMRMIRSKYGITWKDHSILENIRSWQSPTIMYTSSSFMDAYRTINFMDRYENLHEKQKISFCVECAMVMPIDEEGKGGCRVIEEEVQEKTTRTKRRVICE